MADQPAPAHSGLFTTNASPVPLAGVAIDGEISNFCARVAVTQRYVNRETHPIEAVYVFPLDEGAAVCGFEAIIDGTLVVGEVKERDEAFRMYDDAMERGDGGFLLDEERPDVFQASIGNLPPGREVLVKLTYVTELAVSGRGLRFSIPTTVSPRYAPTEDRAAVGRSDAEALNPPRAWKVPYGLEVSLRLSMTGTISRLDSPSHPISVSMTGPSATVTLSTRETALDRDFVLSIDADGLDRPQGWAERDDDEASAMAVAFVPDLGSATSPSDVTFLVDRSGSMQGDSINEVRNALQLCLRSLVADCRFNIVGFGSTFQPLFPTSREYDDASLAEASAHVAALEANLGGTEILPALKFVLEQPAGMQPRQVVVLTDGEVTNTDAVLALAKAHAATTRIFTFGIGAGASHHLVNGLARAGGGAPEFIFPGERIEPKVVRQLGRLLSPALTNVSVDWGGAGVKPATSAIPPIFSGSRLLLYAFGASAAASTIRLTADGPKGPLSFDVAMDASRTTRGRTVATLAARARIRELEESPEWLGLRGSRQTGRKTAAASQEIIALATRYGLLSRETSFVAIERRETPVEGQVQLRRVPIAITSGWGGQDLEQTAVSRMAGISIAHLAAPTLSVRMDDSWPAAQMSRDSEPQALSSSPLSRISESAHRLLAKLSHRRDERAPGRSAPAPTPESMHRLVALQRADGSWELTSALAAAMGQTLRQLEEPIVGATGARDEIRCAWATALALAWLREHAEGAADELRLLAVKAATYLAGIAAQPRGGGEWIDVATNFLATWNARRPAGSGAGA
jgi:Ca-activated chloride channel family protein